MSDNGKEKYKDGWRNPNRIDGSLFVRPGQKAPAPLTPEEGCFSCLGGIALLLIAFAFWVFVYWRMNPAFHNSEGSGHPQQRVPGTQDAVKAQTTRNSGYPELNKGDR